MNRIALVWGTDIPSNHNTTRFQRAACLADEYNCDFYTWSHGDIPDGIAIPEQSVHVYSGRSVFLRAFFPFWILYRIVVKDEVGFDAIHTSYHIFCIFSGFLCSLTGQDWIMDIWDHPLLGVVSKRGKRGYIYKMLFLLHYSTYLVAIRCIRWADLIILSLHSEFAKKHNLSEKNIINITNGTNLSLYQNITAHNEETFSIIYVGYVMEERGIDTLIDAIADIQTVMPQYTVTLVGPVRRKDKQWLQNRIQNEGIGDTINIVGEKSHEETLKRIAGADVCLYPFSQKQVLEYIFPIKIFEYMALGKPTISSNLKGARQILEHGETAILVEPDDPTALGEAILQLYEDKEFRDEIGQQARRASKQYDWSKINQELVIAINTYLSSPDPHS